MKKSSFISKKPSDYQLQHSRVLKGILEKIIREHRSYSKIFKPQISVIQPFFKVILNLRAKIKRNYLNQQQREELLHSHLPLIVSNFTSKTLQNKHNLFQQMAKKKESYQSLKLNLPRNISLKMDSQLNLILPDLYLHLERRYQLEVLLKWNKNKLKIVIPTPKILQGSINSIF